MKRFTALALALCLAFGGTALADNKEITTQDGTATTTVYFTIEETTTYTIVIPSRVALNSDRSVSSATIEAEDVQLPDGAKLVVKLSGVNSNNTQPAVRLSGGDTSDTVTYKIYKDADATNELVVGNAACSFQGNGSSSIYFKLTGTPKYAGTYNDTISFRVELVENEQPAEVQ